jgi:iron complex outermembrane receptor protein
MVMMRRRLSFPRFLGRYAPLCLCALLFFCALTALSARPAAAQQGASISGSVTDAEEEFALAGANVVLQREDGSMATGAATGADGAYVISNVEPGDYTLAFRFIGYGELRVPVSVEAGEQLSVDAALSPAGLDLNAVVVTASRQAEKVLEAPASISVLDAEELRQDVVSSSAAMLRNTTGIDMAQTGVDRYEIALRGFNNAFSGATYVLTDYRQGAVASLGVNAYNMMPITQIDLERAEVVRGPGSALYGAGVDAGVVHFITRDPFTHPGTTLSAGGGSRETLFFAGRHAGVLSDRLGYKLVGNVSRAEEWHFDPDDRLDSLQLDSFRPDALPVDYGNHKYNLNGMLAYRWRPGVTLTANGGFASSKSIFLSGIGTLQSDGFGYSYGQVRLDAGSFFAQAYVNANDAGNSFVYRDAAISEVVDNSILFNGQVQYDFSVAEDRLQLIAGGDYELTLPDTDETINGRNEDDDRIQELGAYVQGTARLHAKLDATFALRADHTNVFDELQLSPRAALVLKPNAAHSVRATFNRAFSSPGTNSLFLDINAGSAGPLTIRARGAKDGYHFQRDAQGDLIASSLIPEIFGTPMRAGMPLDLVYDQVYSTLAALPAAQLQQMLSAEGVDLPVQQIEQLVALLSPEAGTQVDGHTDSRLGYLNLTTESIDRTVEDVVDIDPLKQAVSRTFEVGYKGLLGDRLLLAVDGYYVTKRNFVGPLLVESPFVLAPSPQAVIEDLESAMASGIASNEQLAGALQQLGISAEMAAGLLAGLSRNQLEENLPEGGSPIGIVQPRENATPGQLLLTYRNYGRVTYFGADISTEFLVSDRFSVFGNLSWVNDNYFDADELDEEGTTLQLSMNAPRTKVKAGFDYSVAAGWRASASVRHIGEFRVHSGPYQGVVDAYTLLDVGGGYDFGSYVPGLRLDVTVSNLLNGRHREFIGAPKLGRMALARLTYDLP